MILCMNLDVITNFITLEMVSFISIHWSDYILTWKKECRHNPYLLKTSFVSFTIVNRLQKKNQKELNSSKGIYTISHPSPHNGNALTVRFNVNNDWYCLYLMKLHSISSKIFIAYFNCDMSFIIQSIGESQTSILS